MYYGEKRVENPIRWGMVGGGRGSQIGYIHRSAALRDFNFELVAGAFDIDPERGKDFGKQLHVDPNRCYPDYKTMFAEEAKRPDGVQAVSIATPNGMHYEVCKAALEAGLHVVCEKPLCFTSEQADELVKLAEEKHRVVGVTYGYSGHQLIQQARQMIKNGDLGEIRVINMSFAFGGYNFKIEDKVPSAKWRFDPSKAGPSFALGDVGTHPLFIIEAMIPDMKIDNLMCTKRSFVEGRELEDNAFVIMTPTLSIQFHIQIIPTGKCFVKRQKTYNQNTTDRKSGSIETCRQDQQHQPHKFQCISQFKIRLGIIRHRNESHPQHDLGVKPAGRHRKFSHHETGDHTQRGA